jgi:hypothetical protein
MPKFQGRQREDGVSRSPHQRDVLPRQPLADELLERGFLEKFPRLQSMLTESSGQVDHAKVLEYLGQDGEIARNSPPASVMSRGLFHSVLCVGGSPSDTRAGFLTSASFIRLLSASTPRELEAVMQHVARLLIFDEKVASLLLLNREAVGVVNRQVSRTVTLYINFGHHTEPTFCPNTKRICFPTAWLASNGFADFPIQSLHGPRLDSCGWITGEFGAGAASDPGVLLERWMGYMTWSRHSQ